MDNPRARLPCILIVLYGIAIPACLYFLISILQNIPKIFQEKKYHYQAPSHISGTEILSSGLVVFDNFVNREK